MSRLTKKNGKPCTSCESLDCLGDCRGLFALYNKLAHYEDLEKQGRLIEQKHGYWKRKTKEYEYYRTYWYECSVCGERPLHKTDGIHYHFTDYCPNCGAKMDEVEK